MQHTIYTDKEDLESIYVEFEGRFYKFSYPEMLVRYKDMTRVLLSFEFDSMEDYKPLKELPSKVKGYDKITINTLES